MTTTKTKPHYVDNAKLYLAMVEYKNSVSENLENNKPPPLISNYIGESIMKISTHLAYKPNFSNYTFREEMISDGIENCLQYINNFDPNKSKNPFAYFTQIIFFAFIRRIQKEKKYLYTKYAAIGRANITHETSQLQDHDHGRQYNDQIQYGEWSQEQMNTFMSDFEKKIISKKKIKTKVAA
jgi:hypothetical protein